MNMIRQLVGVLVVIAVSWHLFWEIIHPLLVGLSPIFAYNPDGRVGRYPDSPAQLALFATALILLYVYFMLQTLVSDGVDEFIGMLRPPLIVFVIFLLSIAKNTIFPKLGIDRWKDEEFK